MIKKGDIIVFVSIIVISVLLFVFMIIPKNEGETLIVKIGNEEYCRKPLNEDTTILLPENTVVIEDGYAFVTEAKCNDKICINTGKISKRGETVVCMPARLILEVE